MHSRHQGEASCDHVFSSKSTVLCLPSPPRAGNECTCFWSTVFQKLFFKVDVIAGDANAAAYKYYKKQEYQDLHNSSVAVMSREMQREVHTVRTFESRLHIDFSTNNHFSQLGSASGRDCCLMAILSRRKPTEI